MNYDAFIDEVEAALDRPFEWGEHDCVLFANRCCIAIANEGFLPKRLSKYDSGAGAARLLKKMGKRFGVSTFPDYLDTRLTRLGTPVRGSVVARVEAGVMGYAIGVCVGDTNAFAGPCGLLFSKDFAFAWEPK